MRNVLNATLALLAILLAVQTWRVHALSTEIAELRAEGTAAKSSPGRAARGVSGFVVTGDELDDTSPAAVDGLSAMTRVGRDVAVSSASASNRKPATAKRAEAPIKRDEESSAKPAAGAKVPVELRKAIVRASQAYADGDHATALKLLQQSLADYPAEPEAYAALAKLYHDLGMYDDAIQTYRDWTKAMPDNARAHLAQANLYEVLGMNDEALASLARYEELKEGAPDSYSAAASMYRRLGMPAEELSTLQRWVDAAPTSVQANLALAEYYRRSGDLPSALAQYQQTSALAPGNVTAHVNLAQVYQALGQHQNAQAELTTALSLHPGDTSIYLRLADSYRRTQDYASAIGAYQAIIDLEPGSPSAQRAAQQIARLERQLTAQR